jgi:hypothetical protein
VLGRISDLRVRQYWDHDHLFAIQLRQRLDANPSDPKPSCCIGRGFDWDEIAVYASGLKWESGLPPAAYLDGPIFESSDYEKIVRNLSATQPKQ